MLKPRFLCFIATAAILCLILFTACQEPANNDTDPDNTAGTWVEFRNLEQFPVTIYSDPARQVVFAEVTANGTKKVVAEPAPAGRAFYTVFHLYPMGTGSINIPYNGPSISIAILADKTNTGSIPKLEAIVINSTFIMLRNESSFSLTFNEGPLEKSPLGGGPSIINSGQNAAYEITPGTVSKYSVLRNATTPITFPADLIEFKPGIIYVLTYNGTTLTLSSQVSVLQTVPPDVPENVIIEEISTNGIKISWDTVYGATSYRVYRATGSADALYVQVANITTLSWTDTSLSAGNIYYYKVSAVSGINMVSEQSAAVFSIMPPANVRVTAMTTTSVTLGWNTFSGASGYNVYRSDSEDGTYSKINSGAVSGTAFTDTSVAAYTAYWYKVSVIVSGLESLQSSPISVSTGTIVPGNGLVPKLAWLQSNAVSNSLYDIEINADENIGPQTLSYGDKSGITITLSGSETMRTVNLSSNGPLFTIGSDVTLILDNNITLKGRNGNTTSLVYINSGGTLVMNMETKIIGNTSTASDRSYGGGVYVSSGTFTMNGGEISGNTSTATNSSNSSNSNSNSYGGGVYVSSGTFTMNGGEISGNTSTATNSSSYNYYNSNSYGGGVYVSSGTFTMNGGEISGNTSTATYSYNYYNSNSYGGGVYVSSGTFNMNGGEISGNTSTATNRYGGGVYIDSYEYYGIFRMSGGVIYGNNAEAGLKNTATNGAALSKYSSSITQYGTFSGDTFYQSGDLSTTNTTIRIVNGNLLTE